MERELEDMDTTNSFVKELHQEVSESVKVSAFIFNVKLLVMLIKNNDENDATC